MSPSVPTYVQAWVRQLLDPRFLARLSTSVDGQVDVRLSANNGKVRRHPVVTLDGGSQEMIDPNEVTATQS